VGYDLPAIQAVFAIDLEDFSWLDFAVDAGLIRVCNFFFFFYL
jgi:hypothetical protein